MDLKAWKPELYQHIFNCCNPHWSYEPELGWVTRYILPHSLLVPFHLVVEKKDYTHELVVEKTTSNQQLLVTLGVATRRQLAKDIESYLEAFKPPKPEILSLP